MTWVTWWALVRVIVTWPRKSGLIRSRFFFFFGFPRRSISSEFWRLWWPRCSTFIATPTTSCSISTATCRRGKSTFGACPVSAEGRAQLFVLHERRSQSCHTGAWTLFGLGSRPSGMLPASVAAAHTCPALKIFCMETGWLPLATNHSEDSDPGGSESEAGRTAGVSGSPPSCLSHPQPLHVSPVYTCDLLGFLAPLNEYLISTNDKWPAFWSDVFWTCTLS